MELLSAFICKYKFICLRAIRESGNKHREDNIEVNLTQRVQHEFLNFLLTNASFNFYLQTFWKHFVCVGLNWVKCYMLADICGLHLFKKRFEQDLHAYDNYYIQSGFKNSGSNPTKLSIKVLRLPPFRLFFLKSFFLFCNNDFKILINIP